MDFSGWDMPIHYGSQIQEHHAVRESAGVFDVSHMVVVDVAGVHAKSYLQRLLANDVARLDAVPGKALYSGMLNMAGGVIDDLIVYFMGHDGDGFAWYRVVVNCGCRDKDLAWMQLQARGFSVTVKERHDLSMIAVQGPQAMERCQHLVDEALAAQIADLDVFQGTAYGEGFYARTGYTGEDGLEIMLPATHVQTFWQALIQRDVKPCGLGARDTLRLEAGMNLYGHEMNENVSPLVANMAWSIAWEPEQRDFIGRAAITAEKQIGVQQKLVGLILRDKGVLRAHQPVLLSRGGSVEPVGDITSGSFSPTLGCSIALARISSDKLPHTDGHYQVTIRHKSVNVDVVPPRFVRYGKVLSQR